MIDDSDRSRLVADSGALQRSAVTFESRHGAILRHADRNTSTWSISGQTPIAAMTLRPAHCSARSGRPRATLRAPQVLTYALGLSGFFT